MPRKPMTHKTLYIGDNLPIMIGMESNSVDLIYTDPPFNTGTFRKGKTEKHSFIDTWTDYQLDFAYAYSLKTHYPKLWEMIVLAEDMHSSGDAALFGIYGTTNCADASVAERYRQFVFALRSKCQWIFAGAFGYGF